jgi:hypothetical protein
MAADRQQISDQSEISPDLDFETPDPTRPHGSSFTLQMIMELKGAQGGLTTAVQGLRYSVDNHGSKLDAINEIRADLREITTRLTVIEGSLGETKKKLEHVHSLVIGATAIVGFVILISQVALRFWPGPSQLPPSIVVNVPPQVSPAAMPLTAPKP